jgi:superfamily II DNA or RNA helicase
MGPDAGAEIAALNTLTDEQLTEYVTLWQEKNQLAREEATEQLSEQKKEMKLKLLEIRAEAEEQLELYRAEWEKKNAEIRANTQKEIDAIAQEFETITGKSYAQGASLVSNFADGMESQFDNFQSVVAEFLGMLGYSSTTTIETSSTNIPKLAAGGIVTRPTKAMIGEGGNPEAVVPLNGRSGFGGNTTINIHVQGANAREIWEELQPKIERDLILKGVI